MKPKISMFFINFFETDYFSLVSFLPTVPHSCGAVVLLNGLLEADVFISVKSMINVCNNERCCCCLFFMKKKSSFVSYYLATYLTKREFFYHKITVFLEHGNY